MKMTKQMKRNVTRLLHKCEPGDMEAMVKLALTLGRKYHSKYHIQLFDKISKYN